MSEFSTYDPQIWFNNLERTLKRNGITDQEGKFTSAVTAIDPKHYTEIRDVILNTSEEDTYKKLKS